MFCTVINDCRDSNAVGRQLTRIQALLGIAPTFVGVGDSHEAAFNLVDVLDAGLGEPGVVLVNCAPRNGEAHEQYHNGVNFGYTYYKKTLILCTASTPILNLIKKMSISRRFYLLDIRQIGAWAVEQLLLSKQEAKAIANTQFRSFEFLPRMTGWLVEGLSGFPFQTVRLDRKVQANPQVAYIDNFGNIKLTSLPSELGWKKGIRVHTNLGAFPCYSQLREVPDGDLALVIGSSGLGQKRFLEIVIQGGYASRQLPQAKTGFPIFVSGSASA